MLGSHNSWTFSPIKHWWQKPLKMCVQCQDKNIYEQYAEGVQFFDLRLKVHANGNTDVAHGCIIFKTDWKDDLEELNKLSKENYPIYVRVILEYNKKPNDWSIIEKKFQAICANLICVYPNLTFVGGYPKYNMTNGYLPECQQMLVDKYSSTTSLFKTSAKSILGQVDDLYPKYYASKYNKKNKKLYKDILESKDKVLFIDFV